MGFSKLMQRNLMKIFRVLNTFLFLIGLVLLLPFSNLAQSRDYTQFVDPFIGTGGHGHTFPGATMPFGSVQLSPDTRRDNWDGSSGYHYSDNTIHGFSLTHLSGTGIPDYCDILFAPMIGKAVFYGNDKGKRSNGYASKFSHSNETAEPGYYSVKLDDDGIFAEMTATPRVGLQKYRFPKSEEAKIILDLAWRDALLDYSIEVVGNNRVEGYRRSSSWAKDQVVYFSAEFSKPFESVEMKYSDPNSKREFGSAGDANKPRNQAAFSFKTAENEEILVKVAISAVSLEGARKNMNAELADWDFERVRTDAKRAWNRELSKIDVDGGTEGQITNFYTALYHTMIAPNIFQDVDGKYLGLDKKIHQVGSDGIDSKMENGNSSNYTIFSLWDTFRATHPLYTIIDKRRTTDYINTFIRQYEQGGKLPVWELAANETNTMIGYHSVSVIADAMVKGIGGFDYERAYKAAKHSANLDERGRKEYRDQGFISMEGEYESASKTLEYAYDDFCMAEMARVLYELTRNVDPQKAKEYKDDYELHLKRSQFYKNLFDKETGFMRPRQNGGFVDNFKPEEVTFHFTEGNSWVYSFFVPQDVGGLINLMGGKQGLAEKLDELFTTKTKLSGRFQPDITGLIGQYAHGNEPSHHIAYLYNYVDQPWKTQKYVRKILEEFYKPKPDGLIGNEDCGQMSAWFVLSAAGFYPVAPGSTEYALGSPLFKKMTIHLENGKTFTISAPKVSANNLYVKKAKLNGINLSKSAITHEDIEGGGVLEFELEDSYITDAFEPYISDIEYAQNLKTHNLVAIPTIESETRTRIFSESALISINAIDSDWKIYYTLDNSKPSIKSSRYTKPFEITENTIVSAIAVSTDGVESMPISAKFNRIPNDWSVILSSKPNNQYMGAGAQGLVDGIRGGLNFASGEWQGYQGQDFEATIDLKRLTKIQRLGGGFLQAARSWIWMPVAIEFEVSEDGTDFRKVGEITTKFPEKELEHTIRDFVTEIEPTRARYVRVKAKNYGKLPAWHPGAGYDAYIFIDEIIIE